MPKSLLDCYLNPEKSESGYVYLAYSKIVPVDDDSGRDWQFRIAILPEKENLNKAAKVLVSILKGHEFKILSLNGSDADHISGIEWDGTETKEGNDREQRGKEVCVYMRFNSRTNQYEKTPEEWKQLMLWCWQELQQAGVAIAYTAPPAGEKQILVAEGLISPFSYTSSKPYEGRHGILDQTYYNPSKYDDPLQGVNISLEDLSKYNINISQIYRQRILYQTEHFQQAKTEVSKSLSAIKQTVEEEKTSTLDQIFDEISADAANIEKNRHALDSLCPRHAGTHLDHKREVDELLSDKVTLSDQNRSEKIEVLRAYAKGEKQKMFAEFNDNPFIKTIFLQQMSIDDQKLQSMIENKTYDMQIFYRKLIHLQREGESLLHLNLSTIKEIYAAKAAQEMEPIITCARLFFLVIPLLILVGLGVKYLITRNNEERGLKILEEDVIPMLEQYQATLQEKQPRRSSIQETTCSEKIKREIPRNVVIFSDFLQKNNIAVKINDGSLNVNTIAITIPEGPELNALESLLEEKNIGYSAANNITFLNSSSTLRITLPTEPILTAKVLNDAYVQAQEKIRGGYSPPQQ